MIWKTFFRSLIGISCMYSSHLLMDHYINWFTGLYCFITFLCFCWLTFLCFCWLKCCRMLPDSLSVTSSQQFSLSWLYYFCKMPTAGQMFLTCLHSRLFIQIEVWSVCVCLCVWRRQGVYITGLNLNASHDAVCRFWFAAPHCSEFRMEILPTRRVNWSNLIASSDRRLLALRQPAVHLQDLVWRYFCTRCTHKMFILLMLGQNWQGHPDKWIDLGSVAISFLYILVKLSH